MINFRAQCINLLLLVCLAALSLFSVGVRAAKAPVSLEEILSEPDKYRHDKRIHINIRHTSCYGTCPSFEATLFADGLLIFEGNEYSAHKGIKRLRRQTTGFGFLLATMQKNEFLEVPTDIRKSPEYCRSHFTDASSLIITLSNEEESKRVHYYLGCSGDELPRLQDIAEAIVSVMGLSEYIAGDSEYNLIKSIRRDY